jgi:hypothetical protein
MMCLQPDTRRLDVCNFRISHGVRQSYIYTARQFKNLTKQHMGGYLTNTKSNNASCNEEHPEHAVNGSSVSSSSQDASNNNQHRGEYNCRLSSKIVACQADGQLPQNGSNEQGVGYASANDRRVLRRILFFKENVAHCHEVVLI